ncbi:MAG TPA: fibronectin type III domain-containing protein, partial [Thermodesulfobacteriota bacterium]|nr:fibronectin type III domain-containing protein [Thermodesulfobacteriota bacterium]
YTQSIPDPVTGVSVTMSMGIVGFTAHPFALITWTPPEDNYGGAVVSVKLHSDATTLFRAVGTYTTSARIEGLVPGQLYDFLIESLNVTGELKGLGVTVNNSGAGYIAGGDNTAPATPTGLDGETKHGKLVWTWNKNSESDVSHYIIEIYSATSGGSLLKRDIVPHENNASYTPGYEYQRQRGNLTSSLVGALRAAAVDHAGNTSGFTSRFGLSTDAVTRLDAVNNDFGKKWSARRDNAIALSSSVDVVTLSNIDVLAGDTVFIDASWTAHVTGGAANGYGCGFLVRRNGSTSLGRGTYFCFVDGDVGSYGSISMTFSDQPGAGTHTYTINVFAISNVECFNAQLTASETRR